MTAKILIVDDNPEIAFLISNILSDRVREGKYEFIVASSGEEALEKLQKEPTIDIVLSDISMPGMDGVKLIEKINQINPTIKSVMISAHTDIRNIRRAMNAGAFDFITKPIDFEDLEITIKKTLAEVKQSEENQRLRQEQAMLQRDRIIDRIALRIRQSLSLDEILSTTVKEVQQFLECDRVLVYKLWSDGTGSVVEEAVVSGYTAILGRTFGAEVFPQEYHELYRQGQVRAIHDVKNSDVSPCQVEFLQQFEAKAKLVVPIIQGEELWGLLIAHHCSQTRQWQPLEIKLLQQLANSFAIAIKQAELYDRIQAELLDRQIAYSLLSATLDATADGIVVANAQGKILSFNKKFADMWRIPEEILAPRDNARVIAFVLEQLKEPNKFIERIGELYSQPNLHSHDFLEFKDGRYFERYSQPQYLEGKIAGRVWSFRDVTEQHSAELALREAHEQLEIKVEERTAELKNEIAERIRVEEALRESEQRFRNLVEATSDWVWEMDENAVYTYISPKVYDILGYSPEELLGKSIFDFMPPEEAWRVGQIVGPLAACQQPLNSIENANIHKHGHRVILETSGVPFFDSDGLFRGYRGMNRDITGRKKAESRLRQQALAFENIYDSVIITDLQGRIVDWNPSSERMFGYSKSEVLGKPLGIVQPHEDSLALTQQILEEIRVRDRWKGEIVCSRTDGTEGICEAVVVPLYDEQDEMVATVAVTHDVTERKRAESEILGALEKEKELGELKSRFISMASHDFRTPLASILMSSDLLKVFGHKFSEEKKLAQLNKIQTEVKHMTQLLDDVLLIGKASSGRLEFKPATLELEAFCREIISEIALIDQQKHAFNFHCQGECPQVEMDGKLLRQMLVNLISNAVKYSPEGGNVDFDLICDAKQVIFKIRDSGIGIPELDLARLFEAFHRASNVGNIAGTGLGLAIVKQAVDLHGGTIAVESTVGVGTTFTVGLPVKQAG